MVANKTNRPKLHYREGRGCSGLFQVRASLFRGVRYCLSNGCKCYHKLKSLAKTKSGRRVLMIKPIKTSKSLSEEIRNSLD